MLPSREMALPAKDTHFLMGEPDPVQDLTANIVMSPLLLWKPTAESRADAACGVVRRAQESLDSKASPGQASWSGLSLPSRARRFSEDVPRVCSAVGGGGFWLESKPPLCFCLTPVQGPVTRHVMTSG